MSADATQTQQGNATDQTGAGDKTSSNNETGDKTPNNDNTGDDAKTLSQQLKHWRDKANEYKSELDDKSAAEQKAEETRLQEQQKWQELAEKRESENADLKSQLNTANEQIKTVRVQNALVSELTKHNPVSVDDAVKLADVTGIQVDENGTVTGVDTVVNSLVESKPFLFGQDQKTNVNQGASSSGNAASDNSGSPKTWTRSQIAELAKNPEEYAKHRDSILEAKSAGRITD